MTTNIMCFAQPLLVAALFAIVSMYRAKQIAGLSAELFHRDSKGSPFYNPSLSKTEIIRRAIARGVNRSKIVRPNSPVTDLFHKEHEYLMKIRVGTPAMDIIGIADTGSDVIWTQCHSCKQCVPYRFPLFNPEESRSYNEVRCEEDSYCPYNTQCWLDGLCHYGVKYADGFSTTGIYSKDLLTMDNEVDRAMPAVIVIPVLFGCGIKQSGPIGPEGSGIIGLGPGPASLVRQLRHHGKNKFSYCLVPLALMDGVSHIFFGEEANVEGPGTVTLPLYLERGHFYANLYAFTVGTKRLNFKGGSPLEEGGNMVIDSGSVLTYVPKVFYEDIKSAVIKETRGKRAPDPHKQLDLCYLIYADTPFSPPDIVANFEGGDVPLSHINVFVRSWNVMCLAFVGHGDDDISIIGSVAQSDFEVGFDYSRETVSIKPSRCAR